MKREETPLQQAKRLGLPYVKLVIDRRHLKEGRGKVGVEGPVTAHCATSADYLLHTILEDSD